MCQVERYEEWSWSMVLNTCRCEASWCQSGGTEVECRMIYVFFTLNKQALTFWYCTKSCIWQAVRWFVCFFLTRVCFRDMSTRFNRYDMDVFDTTHMDTNGVWASRVCIGPREEEKTKKKTEEVEVPSCTFCNLGCVDYSQFCDIQMWVCIYVFMCSLMFLKYILWCYIL